MHLRSASHSLADWLDTKTAAWATRTFPAATARRVRRAVLNLAAQGELWDFAAAEQSFLAVESLSLAIGDADAHRAALDKLFNAVESDEAYRPEQYRRVAASVLAEF